MSSLKITWKISITLSAMDFSAWKHRAVSAVRKYFNREWGADDLLNSVEVAPLIRRHLTGLYFTLLCASAYSTLGSYLHSTGYVSKFTAVLGVCIHFFCFRRIAPQKMENRVRVLSFGALWGGVLITPWLSQFLFVDPLFVAASLLATSLGFGFFLVSNWSGHFLPIYYTALLLHLYLLLSSSFLDSAVFGNEAACRNSQLLHIILVLLFMAYVVVYSRVVVQKARADDDYVKHAISLYTDFPAVLLHLTMIMFRKGRAHFHSNTQNTLPLLVNCIFLLRY